MIKFRIKKPVWIGIIIGATLIAAAVLLFFLLRPVRKSPDPYSLLEQAETPLRQNLCLTAILRKNETDAESWERLLANYAALGADPLTLQATASAASTACGRDFPLPETAETDSSWPKPYDGIPGGIAHNGVLLKQYPEAAALAADGDLVYLSQADRLYACFNGLSVRISTASADNLIPAEGGLYYLNTTLKRVQFIAQDGHETRTRSAIPAVSFAFVDETLYIAGVDGVLYREDEPVKLSLSVRTLCMAGGTLYAACEDGILAISDAGDAETVLPSRVYSLTAADDGRLYYINENGYPCRYNPAARESVILTEKQARAVGASGDKVYYLNENNQLRQIR